MNEPRWEGYYKQERGMALGPKERRRRGKRVVPLRFVERFHFD